MSSRLKIFSRVNLVANSGLIAAVLGAVIGALVVGDAVSATALSATAAKPITTGLGMSLSGPLGANGTASCHENLGIRHQCQRRIARPSGQSRWASDPRVHGLSRFGANLGDDIALAQSAISWGADYFGARLASIRCKVRRCMLSRRAVSETLRPHNS